MGGGRGAVTEFLNFLAGKGARPHATASPRNMEVFWAWPSPYLAIYGLISAHVKPSED